MVDTSFQIERVRQEAARSLPLRHYDEFLRLTRSLLYGPTFQWLLVDAPDEAVRRNVMHALGSVLQAARMRSSRLPLSDRIADVAALEQRLVRRAANSDVVHVIGRPGWFTAERWDAFNVRRERIAAGARARLVFWLDERAIELASLGAPDLWAWRGGVYGFQTHRQADLATLQTLPPRPSNAHSVPGIDTRSMAERSRRVAEIREFLNRQPPPPDELLLAPIGELGMLLYELGDLDAALSHLQERQVPFFLQCGNDRAVAITRGRIGDILRVRGKLDEALRIYTEDELPVYERLGDVRSKAITMGKIADILQDRGNLDESLRIRKDEELPVYNALGDERLWVITKGKIADLLQARGELDEALRIRTEEELPVFERFGDLREKARTKGKIADIMRERGHLDEALHIRTDEQLPIYEFLGDVRSRAVTMGKIAEILQDRGQYDEALRIRTEEQIPVYEHLGDVREKAVTFGQIADILQDRGEFGQALRIRLEEELPVYERLGDVREKGTVLYKIALQHWSGPLANSAKAVREFHEALSYLTIMGLPEAKQVAAKMRELGIPDINVEPAAG